MPRVHESHYVSLQIRFLPNFFPPNLYLDLIPTKAPEGDEIVTLRAVRKPAVPYLRVRASILRELPEVTAGSSSGVHIPDRTDLVLVFSTRCKFLISHETCTVKCPSINGNQGIFS